MKKWSVKVESRIYRLKILFLFVYYSNHHHSQFCTTTMICSIVLFFLSTLNICYFVYLCSVQPYSFTTVTIINIYFIIFLILALHLNNSDNSNRSSTLQITSGQKNKSVFNFILLNTILELILTDQIFYHITIIYLP